MTDRLSPEKRSALMSRVKSKDTSPEMIVRRCVHAMGFRYRLHVKGLPGKPDLVFKSRKAVIFVHGCFWHGHECDRFKWPETRREFWENKLKGNRARDIETVQNLEELGYRVLTVWECSMRGPGKLSEEELGNRIKGWLVDGGRHGELAGKAP